MQIYWEERDRCVKKIVDNLAVHTAYESSSTTLLGGDSLELIRKIPDDSISLVLTDPPYHSTKKHNIKNDTAFNDDGEFLNWIKEYCKEWARILRPNGSIFLFCSSSMSARIDVLMSEWFNVLSHVVWTKPNDPGFDGWKGKMKKEALRQWYPHSERIIFAELASEGNLKRSPFGNFLKEQRLKCGLSGHQLTEIIGAYGKINHGGSVSNWEAGRNIPSREQYEKICDALLSIGKIEKMPPYENVIRPFGVNSSIQFTDVWDFNSVRPYKGKHPAEKPLDMLEHCINSTTYPNDIVLDCFGGSGSTAIAALNTGRKSIAIELDEKWVEAIKDRLENYDFDHRELVKKRQDLMRLTQAKKEQSQVSLFDHA
ncbi:site-specific DNA-methyltransferase [bacterium AH-315-M05]|nr:site-specific DNA-methyltransferase [bacterium AH-315-M05]